MRPAAVFAQRPPVRAGVCIRDSARLCLRPSYLLGQFASISVRPEALLSKQSRQDPFSVLWQTLSALMIGNHDNYPINTRRVVLLSELHQMMIIAFKSSLEFSATPHNKSIIRHLVPNVFTLATFW